MIANPAISAGWFPGSDTGYQGVRRVVQDRHLKADHRLDRCWLKEAEGDALHAVLCAAGYNLRWLLRAVARLGLEWFFALCALLQGLLLSVAIRRPGPAALPTCC